MSSPLFWATDLRFLCYGLKPWRVHVQRLMRSGVAILLESEVGDDLSLLGCCEPFGIQDLNVVASHRFSCCSHFPTAVLDGIDANKAEPVLRAWALNSGPLSDRMYLGLPYLAGSK